MDQTISTVLAKNEVMKLAGPGAVKAAYSSKVAVSTIKANAIAKSVISAGVIASTIAPIAGLTIVIGGLILMTKMAESYATSK
jgi:hypothetical protein